MNTEAVKIEAKLRRAGLIVALGLLIELLSLLPLHPLAFIAFVAVGLPIMILGIVLFLLSLVGSSVS